MCRIWRIRFNNTQVGGCPKSFTDAQEQILGGQNSHQIPVFLASPVARSERKLFSVNFSLVKCSGVATLGIQSSRGTCNTLLLRADPYFSIAILLVCHNPETILMLQSTTGQLGVSISFVD